MKPDGSTGRRGRVRGLCLLSATLFIVVSGFWNGSEARPKPLFVDLPDKAALIVSSQPGEKRQRRVKVEMESLAGIDFPDGAPTVGLNLFPDVDLTAVKTGFERRGPRGYTWFGKVEGDPLGTVVLTTGNGLLRGLVLANGRHFEIRGANATSQEIVEIDQSAFPPEGCDQIPPGDQTLVEEPLLPSIQDQLGDTGAVIDVLVVYTPAARTAEGGALAIQTLAQNSVDVTNATYANSGIAPRLNLVHTAEVWYTEGPDTDFGWNQDLARLAGTSDGYMDDVHTLRNTYRADVVVLLVRDSGLYCGLANAIMASAPTAFSLVARSCATSNYSVAHEIGHLQGARHDMYVDSTLGSPYDYNHGHVNLADRLRTVMAYNNECYYTPPGTYCDRLPYWSNPGVNYPSTAVPTGTDTREDNARVLDNTAAIVANFQQNMKSLTVASTYPASGVPITVDLADTYGLADGMTTFTRNYAPDAIVTLTAPSVNGDGNNFAGWTGCNGTSGGLGEVCSVTMSTDKAVVAGYTGVAPTSFTLWSRSSTGQAAVLEIDTATNALQNHFWLYSSQGVGAPWQATSYTRVDDTTAYVLWTRSDLGKAALWRINPAAGTGYPLVVPVESSALLYSSAGVGTPWEATSFEYVGPSEGYVLWTRSDLGKAALWRINPSILATPGLKSPISIDSSAPLYSTTGVGAPWKATSFEYSGPTEGYVLWGRSDLGKAALWLIDPSPLATPGAKSPLPIVNSKPLYSAAGVGRPWLATGFDYISSSQAFVFWTRGTSGRSAIWQINPSNIWGTSPIPLESSSIFDFPAEIGSSFEANSYFR